MSRKNTKKPKRGNGLRQLKKLKLKNKVLPKAYNMRSR